MADGPCSPTAPMEHVEHAGTRWNMLEHGGGAGWLTVPQRDTGRGAGGVNIFIRARLLYVQMQLGTYFSYITSKKKKEKRRKKRDFIFYSRGNVFVLT